MYFELPGPILSSLAAVCSFHAAIPYLEVQCLLSLIHTPWTTRPCYPPLFTLPPAAASIRPQTPAPLSTKAHSRAHSLRSPFALSLRTHTRRQTCVYMVPRERRRAKRDVGVRYSKFSEMSYQRDNGRCFGRGRLVIAIGLVWMIVIDVSV